MKKITGSLIICLVVISFTACPPKKGSVAYTNKMFFPVVVDASFQPPKKHPVHIDSVYIDKNILNVKVNYSGGCKAHYFKLETSGVYIKRTENLYSDLNVFLTDTVKTDACRQFKQETIKFEISKLKHISEKAVLLRFGDGVEVKYSY